MEQWVYVVLLGIAVMVLAMIRQNRGDKADGASIAEFEEALDRFADVMDEDNRQLLETVGGWRRELEAELNRLRGRVDMLERQLARGAAAAVPEAPPAEPAAPAGPDAGAEAEAAARNAGGEAPGAGSLPDAADRRAPGAGDRRPDAPPAREDAATSGPAGEPGGGTKTGPAQERGIRSRYPGLFALHDAGKSVEYIAKKTGMNKGEVMLILQLAKREEQHRA